MTSLLRYRRTLWNDRRKSGEGLGKGVGVGGVACRGLTSQILPKEVGNTPCCFALRKLKLGADFPREMSK